MSELIINYASGYINFGDTLKEKQGYLNVACSAWNIALLKKGEKKRALNDFIEQYKAVNPDTDDSDDVRHDIKLLIKDKIKLYPD